MGGVGIRDLGRMMRFGVPHGDVVNLAEFGWAR